MAKLLQTKITGSLNISGSSLLMPLLTGSTDVTSGSAGQLWINNEGSLDLKLTTQGSYGSQNSPFSCLGAFAIETSLPGSGRQTASGIGKSQNAILSAGGFNSSTFTRTDEWNGSAWSSGGALSTARYAAGQGGSSNAGVIFGGYVSPSTNKTTATEEYNGSSWSSGGSMIIARRKLDGDGLQNAALGSGGATVPSLTNANEEYDGSSWATGASMITSRAFMSIIGNTTNALAVGGCTPSLTRNTTKYDGISWSSKTSLPIANYGMGRAGGNADSGVVMGGYIAPVAINRSFEWNGNTWSVGNTLNKVVSFMASAGTSTGALSMGGSPGYKTDVESYTKSLLNPFTYNAGASTDSWSGGPNMLLKRNSNMAAGTPSAGITFGGQCAGGPVRVTCTEEFDGSAFAAGGALINANGAAASAGTQNAALMAGGLVPPAYKNITEEYNGSAWSAGNAIITTRGYIAAWGGTQNAAYMAGGYPAFTCTEEYDGTNWATSNALSNSTYLATGGGTQNAGILAGGTQPGSTAYYSATYHYDGSSWAQGGTMSTAGGYQVGGGLQDDFTVGGRLTPSYVSNTERYNGVSWCTVTPQPYNTYLNQSAPQSGGSNMLAFGGYTPSPAAGFSAQTLFYCETTDIDSSIPYCLGTWSSTANMITARGFTAQGGTQNAAFVAGGYQPSSPNRVSCNEEFNGTAFSAGGALATARSSLSGGGTQNAGIAMGGGSTGSDGLACTEEYGGTSWSPGGNMISGRQGGSGGGTQNAAVYTLGYAPPASVASTEHYNGTSWSSANNINNIRSESSFTGTQNSAIVMGGLPGPKTNVEEYNGTTWSNANAMPTARSGVNLSGTTNDAIMAGGGESATSDAFHWNGVTFNGVNSIITGRFYGGVGSQGTADAHLFMGGRTPTYLSNVEEWNCASYNIGSWSMASRMNTARVGSIGLGASQNDALAAGGYNGGTQCSIVEEWNGVAWSNGTSTPNVRSRTTGMGSSNAGILAGGYSNDYVNTTNHWNGTAWYNGGNTIQARNSVAGGGTDTAAIMFGGFNSSYKTCTEEYDGATWTAKNAMISARGYLGGAGTTEAALAFHGATPSQVTCTEEFDGTNWATATAAPIATQLGYGTGLQNSGLAVSGYPTGGTTALYNGVGWEAKSNALLPHQNYAGGMEGTSTAAVMFGSQPSSAATTTQLFNDGTCGIPSNPINEGLYCFVTSFAPGTDKTTGISYSSGY